MLYCAEGLRVDRDLQSERPARAIFDCVIFDTKHAEYGPPLSCPFGPMSTTVKKPTLQAYRLEVSCKVGFGSDENT